MKRKIRQGLVALSLGNCCFANAWYPILHGLDQGYFNKAPVTKATLLALLVNIGGLSLAIWLVMRVLSRMHKRWLDWVGAMLLFALLLLPLDFCRVHYFQLAGSSATNFLKRPAVAVIATVLGLLLAWQARRVARWAAVLLGILSPLAFMTVGRSILLVLGILHLGEPIAEVVLPAPGPVVAGQPRILWLIFDETDQRMVFDERPAGVKLPEFDRLRAQSVYATNAYSPADGTALSMPQLISGRRAVRYAVANSSDLSLTLPDGGGTALWRQLPSVFGEARALGANTALVGWYHPYARVLGRDLNYCSWYAAQWLEPARAVGFGPSVLRQVECLRGVLHLRELYVRTCRETLAQGLALATNDTYHLILLHLPPPHLPAVYDPATDQFTTLGMPKPAGYLRNLALADRSLGKLRQAMEQSGEWDKTWVLLSADHSWRDSELYDGRRDLRVPFMLKAPGQTEALTCWRQFNTLVTHDLLLAVLRLEVTNAPAALAWLEGRSSTLMPVPGKRSE